VVQGRTVYGAKDVIYSTTWPDKSGPTLRSKLRGVVVHGRTVNEAKDVIKPKEIKKQSQMIVF